MYHKNVNSSLSSPITERLSTINPSAQKPKPTRTKSFAFEAFSFIKHAEPIPRLPFTVLTKPPGKTLRKEPRSRTCPPSVSTAQPIADNYTPTFESSIGPDQDGDTDIRTSNLGRKYKPVAKKVRPVLGELPEKFRIVRNITGDPLKDLPTLNPNPPPFQPTGRYTQERKDLFDKLNPGFLLPAERDLLHHLMMLHEDAFAWDDSERGHFREDFFPPVEIPVVPHTPWVLPNLPIPPGIYDEVCAAVRVKIDAGVFEPSNSSYRS